LKLPVSKPKYKYLSFTNNRYRRYIDSSPKGQDDSSTRSPAQTSGLMNHGTYGGLLFDPKWKSKRQEILARDQQQCVICRSTDKLQVHHRQYHFMQSSNQFKPPWEYANHLLITLCEQCHQRGHRKYKVPTIKF